MRATAPTGSKLGDDGPAHTTLQRFTFRLGRAAGAGIRRRCALGVDDQQRLAVSAPVYLRGIDPDEIIDTVHGRRQPMIPTSAGLVLPLGRSGPSAPRGGCP